MRFPRNGSQEGERRWERQLICTILLAFLCMWGLSASVSADQASPDFRAGGFSTVPYTDPYPQRPARVEVVTRDAAEFGWFGHILLVVVLVISAFAAGHYLGRRTQKGKPDWAPVERKILESFTARRAEAQAYLKNEVYVELERVLARTQTSVTNDLRPLWN